MGYKLNIKAISIMEGLLNSPFSELDMADEQVTTVLIYALYVANKDSNMTLAKFKEHPELISVADVEGAMAYTMQFNKPPTDPDKDQDERVEKAPKITDLANYLIIRGGMDAHYVMYSMDLHEMTALFECMDALKKEKIEENRLWTYYSVLPHVGSSLKSPQDLITFSWEEDMAKRDALKAIEENEERLERFLNSQHGKQ